MAAMRRERVNGDLDILEFQDPSSLAELVLLLAPEVKYSLSDAGLTQRKATSDVSDL
jgi:hypothetical protein